MKPKVIERTVSGDDGSIQQTVVIVGDTRYEVDHFVPKSNTTRTRADIEAEIRRLCPDAVEAVSEHLGRSKVK